MLCHVMSILKYGIDISIKVTLLRVPERLYIERDDKADDLAGRGLSELFKGP